MPQFCAVLNCRSNSLRDKISFYRFPSETDSCKFNQAKKERRELWIKALCRNDLTETKLKNQRVCEKHFLSGSPAALEDREAPDWIPTQNLGRPDDIKTLEPDRHLSEETRKLHIAPLLDHNYASKPPRRVPQHKVSVMPSTSAGLSIVTPATEEVVEHKEDEAIVPTEIQIETQRAESSPVVLLPSMMEGLGLLSSAAAGLSEETIRALPLSPPVSHSGLTPEPLQQSTMSVVVVKEEIVCSTQEIKTEEFKILEEVVLVTNESIVEDDKTSTQIVIKEESQTSETKESHDDVDFVDTKTEKELSSNTIMDDDIDKSLDSPMKGENSNSWQGEDYVTRCICGFDHDDGYMISCDKCMVWQHVDCMEIERGNIPEEYLCELCHPRKVDRSYAVGLQRSKKKLFDEMLEAAKTTTPPSSSADLSNSDGENIGGKSRRKPDTRSKKIETVAGKRKKSSAKHVPQIVKKKKTLSKREIRPVRRDYPMEEPPRHTTVSTSDEDDLRDWIDSYEEAITNHYSPELRARISVLKSADIHSPHRLMGAHSGRSKVKLVNLGTSSRKIVVAGCNIPNSQPIMEIRGKYMLSKYPPQPSLPGDASPPSLYPPVSGSAGGMYPETKSRFVFHHRLVGPGSMLTGVQVDASTYGNSARFLRSSCTPNSQILHCIEKGTLHLYVVSTKGIESRKEVTLPHRPGVGCALGDNCHLLGTGKRRSRKQILVERVTSREPSNVNNNNNYKEFPQRKRSSSSERPFPTKTTKGNPSSRQEYTAATKVTTKKSRQTLRSAITSQLRRNETKFGAHASIKKP